MARISLEVNHHQRTIEAHPGIPLLSVLRDLLRMTGKEYECRIGLSGAYTGAMDGARTRSCQTPIAREGESVSSAISSLQFEKNTASSPTGVGPSSAWPRKVSGCHCMESNGEHLTRHSAR
jgi:aerobic-type carbon monoxide dehydrogenase small subunit (CoxS/CutS family)